MDYLVSKVALMVTSIALSRGRHFTFCLFFFYVWALYKLLLPEPNTLGTDWYLLCSSAEAVIIYLCLKIRPNGRTLIVLASTIQILTNSFSVTSNALYDYYPLIIRSCEIVQCLVMIVWSPIILTKLSWLRDRLQHYQGTLWMLRLLKQRLT